MDNESSGELSDLFWALRGGNFGILVDMTFKLHKPSSNMLYRLVCWSINDTNKVLSMYNEYVPLLPDAFSIYEWFGYLNNEPQFCVTPVYNGDYLEGMKLSPRHIDLYYDSFLKFMLTNSNFTSVSHRKAFIKSGMLPFGFFLEIYVNE